MSIYIFICAFHALEEFSSFRLKAKISKRGFGKVDKYFLAQLEWRLQTLK